MMATIESISPVHIGNGVHISPLEYWLQDVFVRLDMDALFSDDRFAAVSEQFIRAASGSRYIGDLIPEELFYDHCRYWIPFAPEAGAHLASNRVDVHEFVKTSGRVFLPGSSIKGAILSAAVHRVLCELYPKKSYQKKIEDLLHKPKGRFSFADMMDLVFGHFSSTPADKRDMRFYPWIRVSDTTLASPDQTLQIFKTEVQGAKTGQNLPILCEAVPPGKSFAVDIQTAPDLRWDIAGLLKIADQFYRAVWQRTMKNTAPQSGYLLRLGQGSSAYATSLLVFAEQHRIGSGIYRLFPPRTRKVAECDAAMGWVLIDLKNNGARSFTSGHSAMVSMPMPRPQTVSAGGALADSAPRQVIVKKAPKVQARVVLKRDSEAAGLLRQIGIVKASDAFGIERIVEAMDRLDDEEAQHTVAKALKKKLKEAGTWNKHRLRADIEFYLSAE